MALDRDTILNARYRVLEILGEGGMGSVYKAKDEHLGVTVAVKENLFTTDEYQRQFRVEAMLLATLRHPNLTRVTDHFIQGEIQYIVMDFIEGEDLRDRMDRVSILQDEDVIKIGVALCDALLYLHGLNPTIVHRDVKPGNVRISPEGQVFLVDFGLAKILQGNQVTITGARAMTPGYSPPEQYGTARTDERTDIYSLGATLYSALTGKLPEDGLARAMKQSRLTPIRQHNPHVSRKLSAAIEKALAVQPENRFQSADEFRLALIGARGITRRRITPADLVVDPPPIPPEGRSVLPKSRPGDFGVPPPEASDRPTSGANGEFPSDPLVFTNGSSRTKSRPRPRWGWLFAFLVAGAELGAVILVPGLSSRALAIFIPLTRTNTPSPTEVSQTPAPAITGPADSPTPQPAGPSQTPFLTAVPSLPPSPTLTLVPTFTPTEAATPLGGSPEIAFVSDRSGSLQIWMMDNAGGNLSRITDMSGGACQPDWSPDGQRLIFISPCEGEQEEYPGAALFMINVDGTNLVPVIGSIAGDYDPKWSPDGSQILFTSLRDNEPQVQLLSLDGGLITPLAIEGVKNFHGSWNTDGTLIAFITTRKGPFQIWTMKPDGSEQVRFSRSGDLKDAQPAWSPDGRYLIFSQREVPNGTPSLKLAPIEDGGMSEIRLTAFNSPARQGSFSPDGNWLVYEGWPDGENHDIYLLDLASFVSIPLTTEASFEFDPAWRPILKGRRSGRVHQAF